MASYSWNDVWHLPHKVRNMVRRGYLLKTYNDKKILRARVKTGDAIENDRLDVMHPVGYVAHVKPSEKTEIITMDVGGDSSRRVVAWIVGDREYHPQPDEGEAFYYAPGEKKQFLRIKKKREQQQQGRAADEDSSGNKDSGRETGMHWDGLEERVTGTTKASFQNNADKGQGFTTDQGSFEIDAGQNTQFAASKHIRKGETHRDAPMFVNGIVHAADHLAGGGTTITGGGVTMMAANDNPTQNNRPDGTQPWSAQGQPGTTSLLQTAAAVGTLGGQLNSFQQSQGEQNQQVAAQIADLEARVAALEAAVFGG